MSVFAWFQQLTSGLPLIQQLSLTLQFARGRSCVCDPTQATFAAPQYLPFVSARIRFRPPVLDCVHEYLERVGGASGISGRAGHNGSTRETQRLVQQL
jgi:hypothetical protein